MKSKRLFIMRSQTTAIKAKRLLSANGIDCDAYKSTSSSGCAYVISVDYADFSAARSVLTANGIAFDEE